ncbi:hypothetical protein NC652_018053 [Populus alba x Populus x berolinensis]|nr:hypothetical protein NC652_018053 [Populus alba x Populus x berolinensis]
MIWDEPPQGLQQLLLADIMELAFLNLFSLFSLFPL